MPHKSKSSYNRGGLLDSTVPVLGLGGILGEIGAGAGSGALMGLASGPGAAITAPLGALIGGGIGLFKGLLGHRQEKLMEEQQQPLIPELTAPPPALSQRVFNTGAPNVPTFQLGGGLPGDNAVDADEVTTIDKMLIDLEGPTHEEGGIELADAEVENKETLFRFKNPEGGIERYIFSNTLPKKGKSFADLSRKIDSKTSKRPDSDKITNRTKERDLLALMAQNEAAKPQEDALRMGGDLAGKSLAQTFDTGSNIFMTQPGRTLMRGGGYLQDGGFFSGLSDSFQGFGTSALQSLPGLLGAIGPIAQLRAAQEPAQQVSFDRIPQPSIGPAQFINPTQSIRSTKETFGGVKQGIRESATRPGQVATGLIAAGTREAGAVGDIQSRAGNINAQIANRRQELMATLIQRMQEGNVGIQRSEALTNLASEGAADTARIDALSSLGNIGGQFFGDIRQNQAQTRQNDFLRELLLGAFPNVSVGGE